MRQVTIAEYGTFFALKNGRETLATSPIREPLEALARAYNNAGKLAEALRDCVTTPGALAERSHEYALRRLKTITETATQALAAWQSTSKLGTSEVVEAGQ